MSKKFWIAFVVSFVLLYILEFIFHAVILEGFYASRPEGFLSAEKMQERMIWIPVGFLILAFMWTYMFNRFASKKTVMNGICHGVTYMVFLNVPRSFIDYATLDLSGYCYLWWTIGEVVMGIIIGAVMGAILSEKTEATTTA
jgi:hypothetical protein